MCKFIEKIFEDTILLIVKTIYEKYSSNLKSRDIRMKSQFITTILISIKSGTDAGKNFGGRVRGIKPPNPNPLKLPLCLEHRYV